LESFEEARFEEEFPPGSERVRLVVPGKPQQWARAEGGKTGHRFTPAHVAKQMDLIRLAWERDGGFRFPDATPLELHCGFFYERPKSHYGTGRNAGVLKSWAVDLEPISRPDLDNLLKLLGDSLNNLAFDDDSRITLGSHIKHYLPRTEFPRSVFMFRRSTRQWKRLVLGVLEMDSDLIEGQV
jgi:Holliday junction resolvase RusA-like endonuclease